MTITNEEREERRNFAGASDVSSILQINPHKSDNSVWIEKKYRTKEISSEAIDLGNDFEAPLLHWLSDQIDEPAIMINQRRVGPNGIMAANLDAVIFQKPHGMEAKFTGNTHLWGTPGTNEVPPWVYAQVQAQMYCGDLERVYVAALMPTFTRADDQGIQVNLGRNWYVIFRDPDFITMMVLKVEAWWGVHIVGGVEPKNFMPKLETVQRIEREPNKVVEISTDSWATWQQTKSDLSYAKKAKDEAQAVMLLEMGDAEVGLLPKETNREVTYYEQSRNSFGLTDKYEDRCKECGVGHRQSKFRVARSGKARIGRKFLVQGTGKADHGDVSQGNQEPKQVAHGSDGS